MAFKVQFTTAAYYNLDINQKDVKIMFLHEMIDQLVYIQIPKELESSSKKGMVYKFLKALYDLKQAPRL